MELQSRIFGNALIDNPDFLDPLSQISSDREEVCDMLTETSSYIFDQKLLPEIAVLAEDFQQGTMLPILATGETLSLLHL